MLFSIKGKNFSPTFSEILVLNLGDVTRFRSDPDPFLKVKSGSFQKWSDPLALVVK
jgi:hypothetical protein